MQTYTVCFFGHREIQDFYRAEAAVEKYIRLLIEEKPYVEFLVGRDGDFDQLVSSVIRRIIKM